MRKKKMITIILICIFATLFLAGCISFSKVKKEADERFSYYESKSESINTTYGKVTYINEKVSSEYPDTDCETILSVHGICGGYDQAYEICSPYVGKYRLIAPSRFGYPGSDLPENATIEMQVEAFVELLDQLKLDKVYMLTTSAGGTSAIKFALQHPERLKGLIMYSSGVPRYPATENPEKKKTYAGPPSAFCNDFAMWFFSPLFKPLMGMDSNALKLILPMKQRKAGIIFDGEVSNTVMSNYPVEYNLSNIEVPVLIIHSKDDKLADFEKVEPWISAIKDCTFVPLESGGHMMTGNSDLVQQSVCDFIEANK
ncbi:MAG: alpha/beta fold hydrolase [Spirochaetaceae bacterium]|nr:alpha/beta fold hydrolase [Spirochaetaceae bacterium]